MIFLIMLFFFVFFGVNMVTAIEYQNNLLIKQGIFQMALKVKREFGIDKAVEMSGFSKEELENERLNQSPFPFGQCL
jgi:hypothetical protein